MLSSQYATVAPGYCRPQALSQATTTTATSGRKRGVPDRLQPDTGSTWAGKPGSLPVALILTRTSPASGASK
ncbi:hypothetical protein [Amycolatopsis sp. cmx-4-61]|uniref:hypothetical protein n=1 Tax=Amycolatopsis sp. cmx-4-61 TaxID=2790937 RepID=UPI00397C0143